MRARLPKAGVCLVRVEVQGDHLLITVMTNKSLSSNLHSAGAEPARRFADPDRALEVVAQFLEAFSAPLTT